MLNRIACLCLCAALSGCFMSRTTANLPLEARSVESLQPGVATQADVLQALGAPTDVVQLGSRSAWRYDHTVQKRAGLFLVVIALVNSDEQSDRVWLFFDERGVLSCAGSTITADKAVYELPWSDEHAIQ